MIPVGWLAPGDQWDTTLILDLLSNRLYPTGVEFKHHLGYPSHVKGCVLVVPGRYWADHMPAIEDAVASHEWLLLIRTSDEEDLFNVNDFAGPPNMKCWVQTPRTDRTYGDARLIGVGYSPHFRNLPEDPPDKDIPVFLSAQNTHMRRLQCFTALRSVDGVVERTDGFTQGMNPDEYAKTMMAAKIAPAPAGAVSPDSFRFWEALEAHAIPIADDLSPAYDSAGFWRMLYPDAPLPILVNYGDLPGWTEDLLNSWPANANRITAWWMRQKRRMALNLADDLKALGAM